MGLGLHVQERNFTEERVAICEQCPLYIVSSVGPKCNSRLYLNPLTNETSTVPLQGYKSGCGCLLNNKIRQKFSKCPLGKW